MSPAVADCHVGVTDIRWAWEAIPGFGDALSERVQYGAATDIWQPEATPCRN